MNIRLCFSIEIDYSYHVPVDRIILMIMLICMAAHTLIWNTDHWCKKCQIMEYTVVEHTITNYIG